jgi:hypothetical protein
VIDNPVWTFRAWRLLGAKVAEIETLPEGGYRGRDHLGSTMTWQTVASGAGYRVWYGEGTGRAAALLPGVGMRAVIILRYQEVIASDGRVGMKQQLEVFALFDNLAAQAALKVMGQTSEGIKKKAMEQLSLFFSGMSWYLSENPRWVQTNLKPSPTDRPEETRQLHELHLLLGLIRPDEMRKR